MGNIIGGYLPTLRNLKLRTIGALFTTAFTLAGVALISSSLIIGDNVQMVQRAWKEVDPIGWTGLRLC